MTGQPFGLGHAREGVVDALHTSTSVGLEMQHGQRQGVAIAPRHAPGSHDQVFRLADRICVLPRGAQVGVRPDSRHKR
jgi:hypothetical protein